METDFYIEEVEKLVSTIGHRHANHIINLSNWNPSDNFMTKLAINIPYTFQANPVSYIFSSDFNDDVKKPILEKWNYSSDRDILFFNSGSEAILNTLYFLLHQGCNKIYLLCPTYFSIEPICQSLSLKCEKIFLEREDNRYVLPENFEKLIDSHECLWITNPIYCTGTLYVNSDLERIKKIAESKNLYLVNDESLSLRRYALSKTFESMERYINIVTPHKALCTNGLKFSCVIISKQYYAAMDQWIDILEGCLGVGAEVAIKHFLSSQYDIYESSFCKSIEENRDKISEIFHKHFITFDIYSKSYLLSVYLDNLPYGFLNEMSQMEDLIHRTNAYVIPGNKNSFSPHQKFNFRVNLCSVDDTYIYALERVLHYLRTIDSGHDSQPLNTVRTGL